MLKFKAFPTGAEDAVVFKETMEPILTNNETDFLHSSDHDPLVCYCIFYDNNSKLYTCDCGTNMLYIYMYIYNIIYTLLTQVCSNI